MAFYNLSGEGNLDKGYRTQWVHSGLRALFHSVYLAIRRDAGAVTAQIVEDNGRREGGLLRGDVEPEKGNRGMTMSIYDYWLLMRGLGEVRQVGLITLSFYEQQQSMSQLQKPHVSPDMQTLRL